MMMWVDEVVHSPVSNAHWMLMASLPWLLANITSTVDKSEPPLGSEIFTFSS